MAATQPARCKNLVLDAGPLLSLSPLRGLAETYLTVPQVIAELKDKRAREHFDRLGLNAGVRIEVRSPDAISLAHVIQFAKQTGDYAVLSHADLCVLALTHALDVQGKEKVEKKVNEILPDLSSAEPTTNGNAGEDDPDIPAGEPEDTLLPRALDDVSGDGSEEADEHNLDEAQLEEEEDAERLEPLDVELEREGVSLDPSITPNNTLPNSSENPTSTQVLYDDPSDDDDGEGEWITPSNVALHRSRALDLLPNPGGKANRKNEVINAGCMTGDFAMQNVLLQMGLSLVGVEGKRIEKVKSWVLRCHACFKICKDVSKKFCPSCGNPTLLRASVTIASPTASPNTPAIQIHLKKNFQFKTRGTIYPIPDPKAGSAKKGSGEGLILREDQTEYMRAKKRADGKREREAAKMTKGILARDGVSVGSWMDPDWTPDIIGVGAGGKGRVVRTSGRDGDMPVIGYGKKNPNERKKRK